LFWGYKSTNYILFGK